MPSKIEYNFHIKDYPKEMDYFINEWLNNYDYNSKAIKLEAFTMFKKVIRDLLNTKFKNTQEYEYVKDLPQDQIVLLVKCLGNNVGVFDLHMYYNLWFI